MEKQEDKILFNRRMAFFYLTQGRYVMKIVKHKITSDMSELEKELCKDNSYRMDNEGKIFDKFDVEVELDELPPKKIYYLKR